MRIYSKDGEFHCILKLLLLKLILMSQPVHSSQDAMEQRIMEKLHQIHGETGGRLSTIQRELESIRKLTAIIDGNYADLVTETSAMHAKVQHVYETVPEITHDISNLNEKLFSLDGATTIKEENVFSIKEDLEEKLSQYQDELLEVVKEQISLVIQQKIDEFAEIQNTILSSLMKIYLKVEELLVYLGTNLEFLQTNVIEAVAESTRSLIEKFASCKDSLTDMNIRNKNTEVGLNNLQSTMNKFTESVASFRDNMENDLIKLNNTFVNQKVNEINKIAYIERREIIISKELKKLRTQICIPPFISVPQTGECIYISSDYATFSQANDTCFSHGATLAVPDDLAALSALVKTQVGGIGDGLWIGADDSYFGMWVWINGTEVNPSLWRWPELDSFGLPGNKCALLDITWIALWNGEDTKCTSDNQWRFICEI
ncbi:unnamed protein product [Meganyctiphanes norvegica]|uniref:C-type lectin domain-containing protein n=1 Tax=Meganyctiphanes norvegica TaxID=48144 RepID=A0AAV2RHZ2_MEGNR